MLNTSTSNSRHYIKYVFTIYPFHLPPLSSFHPRCVEKLGLFVNCVQLSQSVDFHVQIKIPKSANHSWTLFMIESSFPTGNFHSVSHTSNKYMKLKCFYLHLIINALHSSESATIEWGICGWSAEEHMQKTHVLCNILDVLVEEGEILAVQLFQLPLWFLLPFKV